MLTSESVVFMRETKSVRIVNRCNCLLLLNMAGVDCGVCEMEDVVGAVLILQCMLPINKFCVRGSCVL